MFLLYVLVFCIIFGFVSEGRIVEGIIGRNVSLSWTYNNTNRNYIKISRNSSDFLLVWPITNHVAWNEKDERLQVYVYNATFETVTVIVSISNVTRKDAGIYKLERSWDSDDFNDSVTLQIGKVAWSLNGSIIESNGTYSQNNTIPAIQNLTVDGMHNIYKCNPSGGGFESDPCTLNISQSSTKPINGSNFVQQDFNGLLGPLLGVGLVIVAISLIIVGVLILFTQRCKVAFSRSGTKHQPSVESSNREVARESFRFNLGRSLTVPRPWRSGYPVINRISGSLQTLMSHTYGIWNPVRQALSLQTLQTLTQLLYANRSQVQSNDSMKATCCSKTDSMSSLNVSADLLNLDDLSSRAQKDSGVSHYEETIRTRSVSLNNFRPDGFEQQSKEEQYSTIDEAKLSAYHCFKANEDDETLQNGYRSPDAGNNDYDFAILPVL